MSQVRLSRQIGSLAGPPVIQKSLAFVSFKDNPDSWAEWQSDGGMRQAAEPERVAVIGSGISGLAAAWLLDGNHHVTLYEAAGRLGGHSNTVLVPDGADLIPVDTGFIVYNELTYPNLTALFHHLAVPTRASDMSFAVSLRSGGLEYSGTNLAGLFAQKTNLLRPRFLSMLRDLVRFYRHAPAAVSTLDPTVTLGAFLDGHGYGAALREDHLLPMAGAIWSAEPRQLLDYPARSFIQFFVNHQLFKFTDRITWRTVAGGAFVYVDKLARSLGGLIHMKSRISGIARDDLGVTIHDRIHGSERYDAVVIGTHADQALALLADASPDERRLLGAFRYSRNRAVLHRDARLMPRRRQVWSSWNFISDAKAEDGAPCVTYWMNPLQGLNSRKPLFVTLNPLIEPDEVLHEEIYEHPLIDRAALLSQERLWALQGSRRTWYCGAYFGSGFHEDGLQAGLAVAEMLGGRLRPWRVPNPSGRLRIPLAASLHSDHRRAA